MLVYVFYRTFAQYETNKKYIAMKKFILTVIIFVLGFVSASAQNFLGLHQIIVVLVQEPTEYIHTINTLKNKSDYTMTLKSDVSSWSFISNGYSFSRIQVELSSFSRSNGLN